jgi:pimeloyl-ACP methyl ester carboxylesterase
MPNPILIVHGYSDGPESFLNLGAYLTQSPFNYVSADISYVSYASLDDQANFEDFSDKLDELIEHKYNGQQIDVICHSTGGLVVRAWLVLQRVRTLEKGIANPQSPVRRLICFAPAHFGSDLAQLGQSFLQKFRATLFNANVRQDQDFQSGKLVLQALEPASPFQWSLSTQDLFGNSYFAAKLLSFDKLCLPFVFAAGNYLSGLQADLVKEIRKPGTDSTVRICGTSLDVRKCVVNFRGNNTPIWNDEVKFDRIPFCVFDKFSHCTIINPLVIPSAKPPVNPLVKKAEFVDANLGPERLLQIALAADTQADYAAAVAAFDQTSAANYASMAGNPNGDTFQQFFFKVSDDTGLPIDDYYLDFHVLDAQNVLDSDLTQAFDNFLKADFHTHSVDPSCRVMMINCSRLDEFVKRVVASNAKIAFIISARSPVPGVTYADGSCVIFESSAPTNPGDPSFLFPNTTTLVEITVVRQESDELLNLLDYKLTAFNYLNPSATEAVLGQVSEGRVL